MLPPLQGLMGTSPGQSVESSLLAGALFSVESNFWKVLFVPASRRSVLPSAVPTGSTPNSELMAASPTHSNSYVMLPRSSPPQSPTVTCWRRSAAGHWPSSGGDTPKLSVSCQSGDGQQAMVHVMFTNPSAAYSVVWNSEDGALCYLCWTSFL